MILKEQPTDKVLGLFSRAKLYIMKNQKQLGLGLAISAGLALLATGYWGYSQWLHARAYKAFLVALKYHDAPVVAGITKDTDEQVTFPDNETKWKKVEDMLTTGFKKYKSTTVGSMFGVLLADMFITQGKNEQAIETLDKAVYYIPSTGLKEFYALKLALLKMDSTNEARKKEGFDTLKIMAEKVSDYTHEAALYHMGFYYWNKKNYQEAQNFWRQLITRYGTKEAGKQGGFSDMAKQKLSLISTDFD